MNKIKKMFGCGILLLSAHNAFAQEEQCVTISASATIPAPYDLVFDTIVDTASYPDWNPYIVAVDPADVKITEVGSEFTLVVFQPLSQTLTFAPEITTSVDLPFRGFAQISYAFNDPFAQALGFPERTQEVTQTSRFETFYETSETFCGPFIPFLPLEDVQAGFDAQTAALAEEAQRRFQETGLPCTNNGKGKGGSKRNNGVCYR